MQPRTDQSKGRLFKILAILWIFPSIGGATILGFGLKGWAEARNLPHWLGLVTLEQWVGLGILGLQVVFVLMAWRGRKRDAP